MHSVKAIYIQCLLQSSIVKRILPIYTQTLHGVCMEHFTIVLLFVPYPQLDHLQYM